VKFEISFENKNYLLWIWVWNRIQVRFGEIKILVISLSPLSKFYPYLKSYPYPSNPSYKNQLHILSYQLSAKNQNRKKRKKPKIYKAIRKKPVNPFNLLPRGAHEAPTSLYFSSSSFNSNTTCNILSLKYYIFHFSMYLLNTYTFILLTWFMTY